MNRNRQSSSLRRILLLTLLLMLCLCLLSACSITQLLSDATDLIDKFSENATNPTGILSGLSPTLPISGVVRPGNSDFFEDTTTAPPGTEPTFPTDADEIGFAIVRAPSASLYSNPSQSEAVVDILQYGERVAVYKIEKGWVYVDGGWAPKSSFYVEGEDGQSLRGRSVVTGTDVNLRSGPGRNHKILSRHNIGDSVYILEEFYDDDLLWGFTGVGWICMDYIYVDGTKTERYGFATVTADTLNVRLGPGTQYSVVTKVKEGDVLEVYHYITVKGVDWACVENGWVCMKYVHYVSYS